MMTTDCTALDLPPGIGKPALRALDDAGICTLDDVAKWQESELAMASWRGPEGASAVLTRPPELGRKGCSFRAR